MTEPLQTLRLFDGDIVVERYLMCTLIAAKHPYVGWLEDLYEYLGWSYLTYEEFEDGVEWTFLGDSAPTLILYANDGKHISGIGIACAA